MNIEEAHEHVGSAVIYSNGFDAPEEGVIRSVSETTVFVLYRGDLHTKGTRPEDLTLSFGGGA